MKFSNKFIIIIPFFTLFLSACSTSTKSPNEFMPRSISGSPLSKISLSLSGVVLDYVPQNQYEAEMARRGLENSIFESNIFDRSAKNSVTVRFKNLIIDRDKFGFEMTARAIGQYSIKTQAGKEIFETTIHSEGKSAASDSFVGVERLNIATRKAISENFKMLIDEMSRNIEKNRAIIEASAEEVPPSIENSKHDNGKQSIPKLKIISTGTGFFVNPEGYLLTNQHVVDGCKSITVRNFDGTLTDASVLATDELNDLAALKNSSAVKNFSEFNISSNYRQGDQVIVYGFPLTGALSSSGNLTIGYLSALSGLNNDTRYLQISAPVQSGNSGGPLADDSGNIIGVVTSKLNAVKVFKVTGDLPQNVNFALKDTVVKSFLQAHGIQFSERKKAPSRSTADVGLQLKTQVAYIQCHG